MEIENKIELTQAIAILSSIISRCEKAQLNLPIGTSQHSLLVNRIKSMKLCKELIEKQESSTLYSKQEIQAALPPVVSALHKCQKAQSKYEPNNPTYRRLQPMVNTLLLAQLTLTQLLEG